MIRKLCAIFILITSLSACDTASNYATRNKSNKILDVSNYNVTLNNKSAVYIKFGDNNENHCSLAVLKSSTTQGYHLEIKGSSSLNVEADLTCIKDNNFYSMSTKNNTFITIDTIDVNDSNIVYKLSSKLISMKDQSYLELKNEILEITGSDTTSLLQ